jgi:hypothetical protein
MGVCDGTSSQIFWHQTLGKSEPSNPPQHHPLDALQPPDAFFLVYCRLMYKLNQINYYFSFLLFIAAQSIWLSVPWSLALNPDPINLSFLFPIHLQQQRNQGSNFFLPPINDHKLVYMHIWPDAWSRPNQVPRNSPRMTLINTVLNNRPN